MFTTTDEPDRQCPSCGVQLLPDGTVDAIDDDPGSAKHYADCTAVCESQKG
jgi:hypothetical protein